jgi:hypothetical protein
MLEALKDIWQGLQILKGWDRVGRSNSKGPGRQTLLQVTLETEHALTNNEYGTWSEQNQAGGRSQI